MWLFKLLVILAFSNAHMIVRGHRYTNTWAVQVNGVTDGMKRNIAEKDGISNKVKVNDKYYLQGINYNATSAGENVDIRAVT